MLPHLNSKECWESCLVPRMNRIDSHGPFSSFFHIRINERSKSGKKMNIKNGFGSDYKDRSAHRSLWYSVWYLEWKRDSTSHLRGKITKYTLRKFTCCLRYSHAICLVLSLKSILGEEVKDIYLNRSRMRFQEHFTFNTKDVYLKNLYG